MIKLNLSLLTLIFALFTCHCFSQISPPGLGKANTADWFAFGVRQELDTVKGKGWQSMSFVGLGRKSNPDNYNPLFKPAILVFNQEFYHQFHDNWQYSLALSYRRQDEYVDTFPYDHDHPKLKQEFRLYSRFSYIIKTSRIKVVSTFRPEFRNFSTQNFKSLSGDFQIRTRFRLQLKVNIDDRKTHRLIASSEQLFSISKETSQSDTWTDFDYRESRFSLYYSVSSEKLPFIFSIGYMNNSVRNKTITYFAHYLAFDIVIENPFKLKQRTKDAINENLE